MGDDAADSLLSELVDGVLTLTLNRPDRLNALSKDLLRRLREAISESADDPAVRCLVLGGTGRAFSAGADLKESRDTSVEVILRELYNPLVRAITDLDKPVIASINGVAAGAGAAIALACDLRVMADTARLTFLFARVARTADSGASWFLPRLVGHARATELLFTGRDLSASEAAALGLCVAAVPADELVPTTNRLASQLAAGPASIGLMKRQLRASIANDLEAQLQCEIDVQLIAAATNDYKEGDAAFLEKRAPCFTGT